MNNVHNQYKYTYCIHMNLAILYRYIHIKYICISKTGYAKYSIIYQHSFTCLSMHA